MNITQKQQKLTDQVEEKLLELELPSHPRLLYEPVRYTLSFGGKRVRPYFTLTACGLCGGEPEEALYAAVAIELLHNFTLLHDDIMDRALTRRGQPSVFNKWDASTAILSGDVMYAWAFEQLQYYGTDARYSKEQYVSIQQIFLESARIVCEGQAYDLEFGNQPSVTLGDYLKMIRGKTAALISGAFMLGGTVAEASREDINELSEIGTDIGIAFQIQDDLMDAVADPSKFGKKRGGDIKEGKKTYLSVLALQYGDTKQKEFIDHIFQKKQVSHVEINQIIGLYHELGVIDEASKAVRTYYDEALNRLDRLEASEYKTDLIDFLRKLLKREY